MNGTGQNMKNLMCIGSVGLVLFIWLGSAACNKNSPVVAPGSNQTGPVDVYLAGWRSYYPANEVAVYWKNNVLTDLTDGSRFITANSIAVLGSDVYVGGNDFINNHFVAKYWKNGTIHNLSDTALPSYVSSMAISGNDVYFAGYGNDGDHKIAKYWKNGQPVSLSSGSNDAVITSIIVTGNNVYAAGWKSNGKFEVATYWRNGIAVSLDDGSKNTEALSIAVLGSDIYIAGNEYTTSDSCPMCARAPASINVSKIWKNGSVIKTGAVSQNFSSLVVSNNDVYIAGSDAGVASYFKNDSVFHLSNGVSEASGIALWGTDIYVTGYENISGHNVPVYWKNGAAVRLTDGQNNSYSPAIYLNRQ